MAADPGFLEQLTGSAVDERAVVKEKIAQGFQGDPLGQMMFTLGNMAGQGLGVAGVGAFNKSAARDIQDRFTADANGIGVPELRARRAIRKELGSAEFKDDGSFNARIKLAARAAEISRQHGDLAGQARALAMLDALRQQQIAFESEKAESERKDEQFDRESVIDVWVDGKHSTGQQGVGPDGKTRGVWMRDEAGEAVFKPAGTYFTKAPTIGERGETLGQYWGRLTSPEDDRRIRGYITGGRAHIRKSRRVIDTLLQLEEAGGVDTAQGAAGTVITFMDQAVRNFKGVVGSLLGSGAAKDGKIRNEYLAKAADPNDPLWDFLELPEEFKKSSAVAQNYRAQIMELAYLVARLAEPSNRGLSDNDIQAALQKIAGNTANPQVMLRRFAEMIADSAATVEDELDVWSGAMVEGGYSREQFENFIGGEALVKYRHDLAKFYEDLDITVDDVTGRATFNKPIDSDLNPSADPFTPGDVVDPSTMTDEEFITEIGL